MDVYDSILLPKLISGWHHSVIRFTKVWILNSVSLHLSSLSCILIACYVHIYYLLEYKYISRKQFDFLCYPLQQALDFIGMSTKQLIIILSVMRIVL